MRVIHAKDESSRRCFTAAASSSDNHRIPTFTEKCVEKSSAIPDDQPLSVTLFKVFAQALEDSGLQGYVSVFP
jgi:hypothetical protein